MREEWRPVVGFAGAYEVSDLGRVRSVDRTISCLGRNGQIVEKHYKGRVLRPGPRPSGHLTVSLCGDTHNVHTLVLEAFVGPRPDPTAIARHLDGDEQNNRRGNLQWSDRVRNGQDKKYHKSQANYVLTPIAATQLKSGLAAGIPHRILAVLFRVSKSTVSAIAAGRFHNDV